MSPKPVLGWNEVETLKNVAPRCLPHQLNYEHAASAVYPVGTGFPIRGSMSSCLRLAPQNTNNGRCSGVGVPHATGESYHRNDLIYRPWNPSLFGMNSLMLFTHERPIESQGYFYFGAENSTVQKNNGYFVHMNLWWVTIKFLLRSNGPICDFRNTTRPDRQQFCGTKRPFCRFCS